MRSSWRSHRPAPGVTPVFEVASHSEPSGSATTVTSCPYGGASVGVNGSSLTGPEP